MDWGGLGRIEVGWIGMDWAGLKWDVGQPELDSGLANTRYADVYMSEADVPYLLTYLLTCLLTYLLAYLLACLHVRSRCAEHPLAWSGARGRR